MSWFLLLTPAQTTGILLQGWDVVSGRVLPEAEATFADADDADVVEQQPVDLDLGDLAGGEADDEEATVLLEGAQ